MILQIDMRTYGEHWLKASVADKLRDASTQGEFTGRMNSFSAWYLGLCTGFHASTGSWLIFTRDSGHHTSGWFKNPDFEWCQHLSISFREPFNFRKPRQFDSTLADEWVEIFFGDDRRHAWKESAKTAEGKRIEVVHWRVFCDQYFRPIHPRGEVYSTEFTEKGWQSWGELHD